VGADGIPLRQLAWPLKVAPMRTSLLALALLAWPLAGLRAQPPAPQPPAITAEDERLYEVHRDVTVRTPDGATICALVIRPRTAARVPTILEFTIYADARSMASEARQAAAHGYAGVVGMTRGKGCSPDAPVPYEHDGADADTLIDWIAVQPWSDGKVGMYGGSYSAFTAWAAAKHKPKALKAIMVGAPEGPTIDTPGENGVVWNFIYPWPFYTTDNKALDDATYGNSARWTRLSHDWYVSGRAYRDLDKVDGTPNPFWDRWISHETFDAYWRAMTPSGADFAQIDIPVLQTAGYFLGGPAASTRYFQQHYRYNPKAEDYLLVGPWDHFQAQRGARAGQDTVVGYKMDPAAVMDLVALRFQWFDYAMKGGARPAILKDRVNYQVTGANVWKHAPSLEAMATGKLRLYLSAERKGATWGLSRTPGAPEGFVPLTIDLADRRDVDRPSIGGVLDKQIDTANGLVFVSDPLPAATEVSGLPSGEIDLVANKRDLDFEIDLYELMPSGDYFALAPYWSRASLVGDPTRRHLLEPGRHTRLAFRGIRLMSRKLAAGSRIVAVVSVIKDPGREINYGTGKPVIDETIADAGPPLQVKWFDDSFLDLPLGRP
jgi:putative CocE/NonD family hydrolase